MPTPRSTVHRVPRRANYDRAVIDAILDEGLVAHVGIVDGGQPFVLPMVYARVGDALYLHGAIASRLMKTATRAPLSAAVTLVDGLVLARSAFHHSMNYRSVVVVGEGRLVAGDEKRRALDAIVDKVGAGRSQLARPPNDKELAATAVAALSLAEASAKVRVGGPLDDEEDLALEVPAGVIPLSLVRGAFQPA